MSIHCSSRIANGFETAANNKRNQKLQSMLDSEKNMSDSRREKQKKRNYSDCQRGRVVVENVFRHFVGRTR
jgi:hypothetical protein